MVSQKYFRFGHLDGTSLLIGSAWSRQDFYRQLYKYSSACQDPKANIIQIARSRYEELRAGGIKVI